MWHRLEAGGGNLLGDVRAVAEEELYHLGGVDAAGVDQRRAAVFPCDVHVTPCFEQEVHDIRRALVIIIPTRDNCRNVGLVTSSQAIINFVHPVCEFRASSSFSDAVGSISATVAISPVLHAKNNGSSSCIFLCLRCTDAIFFRKLVTSKDN